MASKTKKKAGNQIFNFGLMTPGLFLSVGLLLVLLLHVLVDKLPVEAGTNPYLGAWLRLWVFFIFAICAVLLTKVRKPELKGDLLAVLLGLCFAGIVLLGLKNTSYALNGVGGDEGFETAQVTKFASYPGAVDFAYKGLPPFYPPLYLFVLGKAAGFLGAEPYRMLKYGLILAVFILPFLARRFWSWINPGIFSLAALLSLLLFQDWYKPFEWLSLVLFVPWWLYFVDGIGAEKNRRKLLWILSGGLLGAILFSTYTYWFFIGAISLLISLLLTIAGRTDRDKGIWKSRLFILLSAALFSLPYWGPLVASMWTTGGWVSLQNRYFLPEFNNLSLPFFELSVTGIVLLAGLIYLLQSFHRNPVSRSLLTLLIAAYSWQILGYAAFIAQNPLLTFKTSYFIIYILGVSALLGAFELGSRIIGSVTLRKKWGDVMLGGAVALSLFYGQGLAASFADNELLPPAQTATYPKQLIASYKAAVSDGYLDHVVLGDGGTNEISIYLPVYQFLSWAAVYSHPAGLYNERVEFLQELSQAHDPDWFAAALMNNRYSHVDEIILLPSGDGLLFGYLPSKFPERSETEHILFPGSLFDPAYFTRTSLGEFVLFTPNYANNPLASLPNPQGYFGVGPLGKMGEGDDFFAFLKRFGKYIRFEGQDEYWAKLAEEFGP